ncbi:MAG: hypothetical protein U0326_24560 [Polyangiales bacterium]
MTDVDVLRVLDVQSSDVSDVRDASDASDASPSTCATGLTRCMPDGGAAYCADLASDMLNCGRCGVPCCEGNRCLTGVCTPFHCTLLTTACAASAVNDAGCIATTCADLTQDDANCGACGHACAPEESCLDSRCF